MLEKFKQMIFGNSIKDAEIGEIKEEISQNNRRTVMVLCPTFAAIILFLLIFGNYFGVGVTMKDLPILLAGLAYSIAIILLVIFTKKDNYKATNTATYSTIIAALSCGIVLSYRSPDYHTVGFIAIVGALSMTFVGRPRRIGAVIFAGTLVCLGMAYAHKADHIRNLDMINILAFTLLFSVCGYFATNAKLKGYLMQRRVMCISDFDLLTGLNNRNSYERMLAEYPSLSSKRLVCVYIDVNGLHELNDKKGHEAGDAMLQFIAVTLKSEFGKSDTYRIGGDEFVVFSTSLTKEETVNKIATVKDVLAEKSYHIAVGMEYKEGEFDVVEVIKSAELKMRDNKREFYLDNSLTYLRRRDFVSEEDSRDDELETDNKLLIYRYMLSTMNKNTNDYLFVLDIRRDINWFFGTIDERYDLREKGSISNTTAQMLNIVFPDDRPDLVDDLGRIARGEQDYHDMNYRWVTRDGEVVWISCHGTVVKDDDGKPTIMFGRVSESALRHLYHRQNGFWNRQKMLEDLNKDIYWDNHNALMMFEIDGLAELNIVHGREYGDEIIKEFGTILAHNPRVLEFYLIAYNRFAAVIKATSKEDANELYLSIKSNIQKSYGIFASVAPIDHKVFFDEKRLIDTIKVLLQNAGADNTRRLYAFQDVELLDNIEKISLYDEMKESILNNFDGFSLVYQPKINENNLQICGVEALLRYTTESKGKIFPDAFVPILEHTGLIKSVGMWVLETALMQCKKWRESIPSLNVSVNFSVVQFGDEELVNKVSEILHKTEMPADALTIEITESKELFESQYFEGHIAELRARGIKFSVDDFGTGYANFDYLKTLDIDEIKVDRMFIKGIEKGSYNYSLLENIIGFARTNHIKVCLEGVETEGELVVLKDLRPDSYQGYLFCKPYTAKTIELAYINKKSKEYRLREGRIDSMLSKL